MIYDLQAAFDSAFFSLMGKTPLKNLISQNQRVLVQKVEKVKIEKTIKRGADY